MGADTSLCMWIDFSSPDAETNYFVGNNSSAYGIRYTPGTPGTVLFFTGGNEDDYTTLNYDFPAYRVHLTMVRTTTRNVDWYINGALIGSTDPGATTAQSIRAFGRRSASSAYYAKCKMDEIAFFNEELSIPNIKRVML